MFWKRTPSSAAIIPEEVRRDLALTFSKTADLEIRTGERAGFSSFSGFGQSVEEAIDATSLIYQPFPHLVVDDLFSRAELQRLMAEWPAATSFSEEPGGLQRFKCELVSPAGSTAWRIGEKSLFWSYFTDYVMKKVVARTFQKFSRLLALKVDKDIVNIHFPTIQLFEASENFVEHTPHQHYDCGPDWIFTLLIYVDDHGRSDRGTSLYQIRDFDLRTDYHDAVSSVGKPSSIVKTADFKPGSMLAILDSPISVHGSAPFNLPQIHDRGRRIVRAHVALHPHEGQRLYNAPAFTADFMQACAEYRVGRDPSIFERFWPGFANDRKMVMAAFEPERMLSRSIRLGTMG